MKIAFIQKFAYEKISVHFLAGALRDAGHECWVFIEDLENDFETSVVNFAPDYLAVSLFIGEAHDCFNALCRLRLRLPSVTTLAGGPFTLIFPDIYRQPEIDYVFRGDCEVVLPEFLRRHEQGQELDSLPGISWLDSDGVAHVNNTFHLNPLGNLPAPDRDLYYRYEILRERPTKMFIGSRGCPYRCTYCYNAQLAKFYDTPYWRVRPVQDVIQEIKHVSQKHGLSWVHFVDGTFNANLKWLKTFLDAYAKAHLPPFLCNCRVENINDSIVRRLKESGCDRITFGIQSGNTRIRNELAGRKVTNAQIKKLVGFVPSMAFESVWTLFLAGPGKPLRKLWILFGFAVKLMLKSIPPMY